TGPSEANVTAIESGLQAGERVVTDGIDRLREGARVEVTDPNARPQRPPGAAPGADKAGAAGKAGGDWKTMDPAKREEMKKKLEAMTPEQREEFRKRRAAQGGSS